jgi:diphthine-ammonia ligase
LFSGGKDSTYATWIAQHQGWEIGSLVTVNSTDPDSTMFHTPNVMWTRLQAEAMDLPHKFVEASDENAMLELRESLIEMKDKEGISGIVTGAVASDYQKTRFDNMCEAIGLKTHAPLWHKSPRMLVEDLKRSGFRIILTAVAAKGLDQEWLGKELSGEEWSRLENLSRIHSIHLTGEGGEYESFVLDAPFFKKEIEIQGSRIEWHQDAGRLAIEKASLRDKLGH